MGKREEISFPFYPKDWLTDPVLRGCSEAARGVWMDLICYMWLSKPKGYLPQTWDVTLMSQRVGCDKSVIQELIDKEVLRMNEQGWYSKRVIEVVTERQEWRQRQRNHRDKLGNGLEASADCHDDVTAMSRPSPSLSPSPNFEEDDIQAPKEKFVIEVE